MILSKSNLFVIEVTKPDTKITVLNNMHIEEDGTSVARNSKSIIMVSPVLPEIKEKLIKVLPEQSCSVVTVPAETALSVLKSIGTDKQFKGLLEHTDLQTNDDGETLEELKFTLTDGKRKRSISGKKYERKYIDYLTPLADALSNVNTGNKIVLDINRLILLLQTIKKICPDTSKELPVFIEFTNDNDVIIRAINPTNGQRVLALMTSYKGVEGKWLQLTDWERKYFRQKKEQKCSPRKIRIKKK